MTSEVGRIHQSIGPRQILDQYHASYESECLAHETLWQKDVT